MDATACSRLAHLSTSSTLGQKRRNRFSSTSRALDSSSTSMALIGITVYCFQDKRSIYAAMYFLLFSNGQFPFINGLIQVFDGYVEYHFGAHSLAVLIQVFVLETEATTEVLFKYFKAFFNGFARE